MSKRRRRKDIGVNTPSFRHEEEVLIRDTTEIEALDVSKVASKIGKRLSSVMILVGVSLSSLSAFGILSGTHFFSGPLFVGGIGFLGGVNLLCGLILLAKEYI